MQRLLVVAVGFLVVCMGISFIIMSIGWSMRHAVTDPAKAALEHVVDKGGELAERSINAFKKVLNLSPIVTVHGDSVFLEQSSIAELAIVERKSHVFVKYEGQLSSLIPSTKVLIVSGDFVVKAGYDLNKPFHIQINSTGQVLVDFPEPEILSIEPKGSKIEFSENGWVNYLTPEDEAEANRELLAEARSEAEKSDLKKECQRQIETRIKDLVERNNGQVIFRYQLQEKGDLKRD